MKTKDGKLYVIEVNASPGTEGIEMSTKVKVAEKVLKHITNKENWTIKPTESGYIEMVTIETMGEMKAKLDTGNGSYSVIHSDGFDIKDGFIG